MNGRSVAGMAFGTRKGVDVLIVIVAFFTRHVLSSPDRFCDVGGLLGEWLLDKSLARVPLLS
jgi:hypothetical protein